MEGNNFKDLRLDLKKYDYNYFYEVCRELLYRNELSMTMGTWQNFVNFRTNICAS